MDPKKSLEQATDERQIALLHKVRALPDEGETVTFRGKRFLVLPNVLPPSDDSVPLIETVQIRPGDVVLDVGCGSGVLGLFALHLGAARVVALDLNPNAIENTRRNADLHGFAARLEARVSDVFAALGPEEVFDVILANLPFRNKPAADVLEAGMWDTDFQTHVRFFEQARRYLKADGRMFMTHASFGDLEAFLALARSNGFFVTLLEQRPMPENPARIYYAYRLDPAD